MELTPFRLEMPQPGLLTDIVAAPFERRAPGPEEIEIEVAAAGLNYREVLRALGVYPADNGSGPLTFDGDCAGRVVRVGADVDDLAPGDAVVGFSHSVFGTHALLPRLYVVPKPSHLSFEQAATVPTAFMTTWRALVDVGRMEPGERVLIHAAAGGVGLAAVQLCQARGAIVFATAGKPEKRAFLHSLGVQHVFSSRSLEFFDEIRQCTSGEGVDLVLNSLAGEFIPASLELLRAGGRFLEIGLRDIYANMALPLLPFRHNLSFSGVMLQFLPAVRIASLARTVMAELEAGRLQPLPHRAFPATEAVQAFQHMRKSNHIGKVVVAFSP